MTYPTFSIITPTCKRPQMLQRAVRSILAQTFTDFECIIVDDANDPATEETVRQFHDGRLVLVCHDRNKGAAAAYNTGIQNSRGKMICILDDDDEYCPDFLEKMHRFFQTAPSGIGFAWTGIRFVRDMPEGEALLSETVWPACFSDKSQAYVAATTIGNGFGLTMKRECLAVVGLYNEAFYVCNDTEHLFRLARKFDFGTIPEILVKIHCHESGQLTQQDKYALRLKLHEKILIENADFLADFPAVYDVHYRRLAQLCFFLNRNQKGRKILLDLWKKTPLQWSLPADIVCYTIFGVNFSTALKSSNIKNRLKRILR